MRSWQNVTLLTLILKVINRECLISLPKITLKSKISIILRGFPSLCPLYVNTGLSVCLSRSHDSWDPWDHHSIDVSLPPPLLSLLLSFFISLSPYISPSPSIYLTFSPSIYLISVYISLPPPLFLSLPLPVYISIYQNYLTNREFKRFIHSIHAFEFIY